MAYYECGGASKEEPESIIITLVPFVNPAAAFGRLSDIYFYIDDVLITTYSDGSFAWGDHYKTYTYTSPKSNKSVNINTIANIIDGNGHGYYVPVSIQLGINGIVVSTLYSDGDRFLHGGIVYRYTFS